MSENSTKPSTSKRLLWCSRNCLLDNSSGAAISSRQMLLQLHQQGWQVMIVGAGIFDSQAAALDATPLFSQSEQLVENVIRVKDGRLLHHIITTKDWRNEHMQLGETELWLNLFERVMQEFQPQIVFGFGGRRIDWVMLETAKSYDARTVMYLANDNYHGHRWHRDVDLLLTNSQAAGHRYQRRLDREVVPLGIFVDPQQFIATTHKRERVLFINPSLTKGAGLMAALALYLEKSRPDIVFEIVASRGSWETIIEAVSRQMTGTPRKNLSNIILTPNTYDMRPVYGRARVLMAPSLCWEAFGRVVVESLYNGIPVITTPIGGLPEAMRTGGVMLELPSIFYQPPHNHLPDERIIRMMAEKLCLFYDDENYYQRYTERARDSAKNHSLHDSSQRLNQVLKKLL